MTNTNWINQCVSIAGAIIVVSAYVGHQLKVEVLNPDKYVYNIMNCVAGLLLTYAAVMEFQLGFIFMEGVWAIISAYAIGRLYFKK